MVVNDWGPLLMVASPRDGGMAGWREGCLLFGFLDRRNNITPYIS